MRTCGVLILQSYGCYPRHPVFAFLQLHSSKGPNDVLTLLAQIRHLSPTAMACPPNIWAGVHAVFIEACERAGVPATEVHTMKPRLRDSILARVACLFGTRVKFLITGGAPTSDAMKVFVRMLFPGANFCDSCKAC